MNNNFWDIYNIINEINIKDNKKIVIASVKKDNTVGIDIRHHYQKGGEWNYGKGLVIPANQWDEFQKTILDIKK